MSMDPQTVRRPLWTRITRRQPWESIGMALIAGGIFMLMQPFSLDLYSYSLMTMLGGVILFMVAGKLPEAYGG